MVKQEKKQEERIIARVRENKANNNQKLLTIPKNCSLKPGDYVEVKKIRNGAQVAKEN